MRIFFLQAGGESLVTGIAVICFFVLMFILLRAVMLWYWKIDLILKELQDQNTHLKRLVDLNTPPPPGETV